MVYDFPIMQTLGAWDSEHGPAWVVTFRDIDEELSYLRDVVEKWRGAPLIRNLAVDIIRSTGTAPKDKKSQALAIGQHVQNAIYYVHEMPERFQTPAETLRLQAGDCDDTTVLVCALLESIGIPSALVCMNFDEEWKHIFPCAVMANGTFLPLDTTLSDSVGQVVNPVGLAQSRGKIVRLKVA